MGVCKWERLVWRRMGGSVMGMAEGRAPWGDGVAAPGEVNSKPGGGAPFASMLVYSAWPGLR